MTFSKVIDTPPNYNAAPTHQVPVARQTDAGLEATVMQWGVIPSWAKGKKMAQINARADTVATKPMFRTAFKKQWCLNLADGYYEWMKLGPKQKQPCLYRMADEKPFAFAGLCETWHNEENKPIESCAILTTDANDLCAESHNRMPVNLDGAGLLAWMDPDVEPMALQELLKPYDPARMMAHTVDPQVGKVAYNNPDCIKPYGTGELF